jgi:biopolymer transport protein ExbD
MVSLSMVKNMGIPVALPAAATGGAQSREESATISIDAAGKMFYNKQQVDDAGLDVALKDLLGRNPDPRVFINGDTKAEFGRAIAVLDEVRKLGITKVAIETQPKPAP